MIAKRKRGCVACLYRVGLPTEAIAKRLFLSPSSCRGVAYHEGIKHRKPSKVKLKRDRILAAHACRYIAKEYAKEASANRRLDGYWRWHPEVTKWKMPTWSRNSTIRRKEFLFEKTAGERDAWRCGFCGCDSAGLKYGQWTTALVYCSKECKAKGGIRLEKLRLQSDTVRRQRKQEIIRRSYHRKPKEFHRARALKKLLNPLARIAKSHRNRLRELIKKGAYVKSGASLKLFGCSMEFLRDHLESLFTRGMSWKNYGSAWHVDHIIPLAKFDLMNPAQRAIAFNWQNLRPLFAEDNLRKADKIEEPQQYLPLVLHG